MKSTLSSVKGAGIRTSDLSPAISAQGFADASRSEATRRAYRSDWASFTAWCREHGAAPLPATPSTVASYLADMASSHKPSTIQRHLAAINGAHRLAGTPSPTAHEAVRLVMQGIRRTLGVAPAQARPIGLEDLRRMLAALPKGMAGDRDRALLLVGWAGAFRRAELVALDVEDVEATDDGLVVRVRHSKTDQQGAGREVGIPLGTTVQMCPVKALREWLEAASISTGPLFRKVDRHGHAGAQRLNPASVAEVVKRAATLSGLDPTPFSGHSLRAGLATSAAANGATESLIMAQTGHKSTAMVRRYIRRANLFKQNAASIAGL